MHSINRETATERIPVLVTPSEKNNFVIKAKNAGISTSEYMRRAAEWYTPANELSDIETMIDKMNEATQNAEKKIDETLAFIYQSNVRIAEMEQAASEESLR